eukprot:SAG22_NODE_300_length_12752_cov_3.102426_9_plen_347_part_00
MSMPPGDRVRLHGLSGRAELNGTCGTVTGQRIDSAGQPRLNVRLENGETIALKSANLAKVTGGSGPAPAPAPGGGGPTAGSGAAATGLMGRATAFAESAATRLRTQAAALGLPPQFATPLNSFLSQMTATQLLAAMALGVGLLVYWGSSYVPLPVMAAAAAVGLTGTQTAPGRRAAAAAAARFGTTPDMVMAALVGVVAFGGSALLKWAAGGGGVGFGGLGGAGAGAGAADGAGGGSREVRTVLHAYKLGFKDGEAGNPYDPPDHVPLDGDYGGGGGGGGESSSSSSSSSGGSGIGIYKLFRYGMVANTAYRLGSDGAGGWSPQLAMANARANPTQVAFAAMMLFF